MDIRKVTGRIVSGTRKYKLSYKGVKWLEMSAFVTNRDKQCLKCGSKRGLQADHFKPVCYIWVKQFFNPNKIQTLCKACHLKMPKGKERWQNHEKFIYLK